MNLGVEYTNECFCGNEKNLEDGVLHTNASECKRYPCPGNELLHCGGFNAVAVYSTGVLSKFDFLYYFFLIQ
jgi:hypothetical protein